MFIAITKSASVLVRSLSAKTPLNTLSTKFADSELEFELLELVELRRASNFLACRSKRLCVALDKEPRIEPRMDGDSLLSADL